MTREEHLLTIVSEECAEISKQATKALRFGLEECAPGTTENNAKRILLEVIDLTAVVAMLIEENSLMATEHLPIEAKVGELADRKRQRVEHYLAYSKEKGKLI